MKFYNPFKYKVYSYKQIFKKLDFYIAILMNLPKEKQIDCILAIESGGLHTAAIINKYLKLPVYTIILKSYDEFGNKGDVYEIDNGFRFEQLQGKNVLVVDDLIDSGDSIIHCMNKLDSLSIKHSFMVIFYTWEGIHKINKACREKENRPNNELCFIVPQNLKPNKWVVFPWEVI